jgi:hypothetical protein
MALFAVYSKEGKIFGTIDSVRQGPPEKVHAWFCPTIFGPTRCERYSGRLGEIHKPFKRKRAQHPFLR